MAYPSSWSCPVCSSTVSNSSKCTLCGYVPPSESGSLDVKVKKESLLKQRMLAFLIDIAIVTGIGALLGVVVAFSFQISYGNGFSDVISLSMVPIIVLTLLLNPVYFFFTELKFNETYGKRIMKIRIASDTGDLTVSQILIRNITRFVEVIPLYIPSIVMISSNGKRLGDRLAHTSIIRQ